MKNRCEMYSLRNIWHLGYSVSMWFIKSSNLSVRCDPRNLHRTISNEFYIAISSRFSLSRNFCNRTSMSSTFQFNKNVCFQFYVLLMCVTFYIKVRKYTDSNPWGGLWDSHPQMAKSASAAEYINCICAEG